jgi:hypothetical protein
MGDEPVPAPMIAFNWSANKLTSGCICTSAGARLAAGVDPIRSASVSWKRREVVSHTAVDLALHFPTEAGQRQGRTHSVGHALGSPMQRHQKWRSIVGSPANRHPKPRPGSSKAPANVIAMVSAIAVMFAIDRVRVIPVNSHTFCSTAAHQLRPQEGSYNRHPLCTN